MTETGPGNGTANGCGGHTGLGDLGGEFRTVLLDAIERVGPLLDAAGTGPPDASTATTCAVCPVCALLAALRGERTELSIRLAEHASGLLAVLRAALEEGGPGPSDSGPPSGPRPGTGRPRPVQHITVVR